MRTGSLTTLDRAVLRPVKGRASPAIRGTVLLVDDEPGIRTLVRSVLARDGYSVLSASSAEDALALADERSASIQVLLTDVCMPGMGGLELAGKLARRFPHIKPIFMSGSFNADSVGDTPFLRKPFSMHELLQTVQARMTGR